MSFILFLLVPVALFALSFCFGLYSPLKSWAKVGIVFGLSFALCLGIFGLIFENGGFRGVQEPIDYLGPLGLFFLVVCLPPTVATICGASNRERSQEKRLKSFQPDNPSEGNEAVYHSKRAPRPPTISLPIRYIAWTLMILILGVVVLGFTYFGACLLGVVN